MTARRPPRTAVGCRRAARDVARSTRAPYAGVAHGSPGGAGREFSARAAEPRCVGRALAGGRRRHNFQGSYLEM